MNISDPIARAKVQATFLRVLVKKQQSLRLNYLQENHKIVTPFRSHKMV